MLDSNEVGPFIAQCSNAPYLHHLTQLISVRLREINAKLPSCKSCGGKKKIRGRVGGEMADVPCPSCQPATPATESASPPVDASLVSGASESKPDSLPANVNSPVAELVA